MAITELRIRNYRSIREMELKLQPINVLVGPNGCGKSNLYRSMQLLWHAAQGSFSRAISEEGGMGSVLWAGPTAMKDTFLKLGFVMDDYEYQLACGLVFNPLKNTLFREDPVIKSEEILWSQGRKKVDMLMRDTGGCTIRDVEGVRDRYNLAVREEESIFSQILDPIRFPHISMLRNQISKFRFYHTFRTDFDSPLRTPQVAPRTPILAHDGRDLAAALRTIEENGDGEGLKAAVSEAFEGAQLMIWPEGGLKVVMAYPGISRPLSASELSDGTLRFLCLLAALKSPMPAPLLALNEPESSLHPDLLPTLAKLISDASTRSQIWISTHSAVLSDLICKFSGIEPIRLTKVGGATRLEGWRQGRYEFD